MSNAEVGPRFSKTAKLKKMSLKDELKKKLDQLDQKVKAKLAVHEMDPKLKKMYKVREDFRKVGKDIDESIDMIERMKKKIEKKEDKQK